MKPTEPISLATPVRLMRQMSHDMRGPLGVLTCTSDMFALGGYGELTPKQAQASERIRRNSHRLLALLEDLMAYVKAEAGQFPLMAGPFAPRMMLTELLAEVQPMADTKGLTLTVTTEDAVPGKLVGDEITVRRIILALLWNAVAFTVQGDVRIVSGWTPEGHWQITVQDTGPGISSEDAPHIFELFWRGTERPQVPTSGCGLGLPMARSLAKVMQGNLILKETGASGSTFCLQLPLSAAQEAHGS